ncbi:MAG: hypothetical protein WAW37_00305 [Syntrophobacteraceae bacterium]
MSRNNDEQESEKTKKDAPENEFDKNIDDIKKILSDLDIKENGDWLRSIYISYKDRFISDNNRIWTTAAIIVPLSFSPLVFLPKLNNMNIVYFIALALASLSLMLFWLLTAEAHRSFQNKSMTWLIAIEEIILGVKDEDVKGGPIRKSKVADPIPTWLPKMIRQLLESNRTVQRIRWRAFYALLLCWFIAFLGYICSSH